MATSQEPVTTWTVTYGQIIYTFAIFLQRKICISGAENRPRQQWTMATTKFCEGAITMYVPVQKFVTLTMGEIIRHGWIRLLKKMCNGILHMGNIFLRKSDKLSWNRKWKHYTLVCCQDCRLLRYFAVEIIWLDVMINKTPSCFKCEEFLIMRMLDLGVYFIVKDTQMSFSLWEHTTRWFYPFFIHVLACITLL